MAKKPLIIILSGTYGVGKTTLAHHLGADLQIMTRVSLSGITSTVKTLFPGDLMVKNWNKYDRIDTEYIKDKFKKEAELIGKVIHNIADCAEQTGENYIIDGSQLLPEFLPMDRVLFFYIGVSDSNKHKMWFSQPTITRVKHKNNPSYDLAQKVREIILNECKDCPIFKIDNIGTPEETSRKIINIIKETYPDYAERFLWFEKKL